jgi:DNA-binding PadR family transcriptional regulator
MLGKISEELRERIIKSFMDLIILKELRNSANMSGYDVITLLHRRFHMLLSAGSLYSTLYAMEREELVEGFVAGGKRVYKITKKGEEKIQSILRDIDNVHLLIEFMLGK